MTPKGNWRHSALLNSEPLFHKFRLLITHYYVRNLEEEMATHSSVLGLENPRNGGAWWASVYGVAQSRTQLKRLSSSSST